MRTLLVTKIISSLIVVNSDEFEFLTKALILKVLMRTLLVMKIISSLIVVNSDELEFLTKALILKVQFHH